MANPVVQWQILTQNPDETVRFYRELFGWTVHTDNALGYREISTGSSRGINGGVWPAPPGASTFVQLFIEVEDVERYIAAAVALGAEVLVPRSELPDGDVMAILRDTTGLPFGLYMPRRAI